MISGRVPLFRPVTAALSVVAVLMLVVMLWLDRFVESTIRSHAEHSARRWTRDLQAAVPDLSGLIKKGVPDREQADAVSAVLLGSDIFLFKLFTPEGNLRFISATTGYVAPPQRSYNPTAEGVAKGGHPVVIVASGRDEPAMPDWYVEAYVPVEDDTGTRIGVVETYVDVSGLATALRSWFKAISILLLTVCALIYVIPSVLLIRRNDQLRERDLELRRISNTDPLTGLLNRGAFNRALPGVFEDRDAKGESLGIFFVDLDKFKSVNDRYGHEVGDQLLRHIASSLRNCVRDGDLVARLGGDEFVILMPGVDPDAFGQIEERTLRSLKDPLVTQSLALWPGCSIGAHLSPPGESSETALHHADIAVYQAKAEGRGTLVRYSDRLDRLLLRRRHVENVMREGLVDGRFFLEFQPIFDAESRLEGFEALLRLRESDGSLISPSEFIPIAEQTSFIEALGLWVVRSALLAARAWPEHVYVSINISHHQFRKGDLPDQLRALLEETRMPPGRVCLELTESIIVETDEHVSDQLIGLKALNVSIAVDDFGTGYSSLAYLWRYRFDRLKIDRSFLEGYEFDQARYRNIIETMVLLGHRMNMCVTVEGVERDAHLQAMRDIGCDQFQGFLLSRPVPETQAAALARSGSAAPERNG